MAVLDNNRYSDVLPLFEGRYVIRSYRGKLVAQKWPRKRGKPKTEGQWRRQMWFRLANELINWAPGSQVNEALRYAPNGPLYPRDFLMAAMVGGMYTFEDIDGRRWYPMSLVNQISQDLDVLGQLTGSMLYRGDQLWTYLPPPEEDQIIIGKASSPTRQNTGPVASVGLRCYASINSNIVDTGNYATKGWHTTTLQDLYVIGGVPRIQEYVGRNYRLSLCTVDSSGTIQSILAQKDYTGVALAIKNVNIEFDAPVKVDAGTTIALLISYTGGSATTNVEVYNSTGIRRINFPHASDLSWDSYSATTPSVSLARATGGFQNPMSIDLTYRL